MQHLQTLPVSKLYYTQTSFQQEFKDGRKPQRKLFDLKAPAVEEALYGLLPGGAVAHGVITRALPADP